MDRFMGCVDNELATITGLDLTVAPRRPAHMTHKCARPLCPSEQPVALACMHTRSESNVISLPCMAPDMQV